MLVHVLVGHDLALQLGRGEMAHVAAEPVLHGELDHGVRQHLLDAAAFDLAGGEGLVVDHGRRLRENQLDPMRGNLAAIEHATIGERTRRRSPACRLTEIVLSAAIQCEVRRQQVASLFEEANQAAPVIVMTMAEDESVDLARIDSLQLHIGHQGFRRVAEIEQDACGHRCRAACRASSERPHWAWNGRLKSDERPTSTVTPFTFCGREKVSKAPSTSTRTVSLSMVGTSIGAAAAISMHVKAAAAAAPARAAEAFKKSRRPKLPAM